MPNPRERLKQLDLVEAQVQLPARTLSVLRPRDAEALLDEEAFEHEEFLPYWAELWSSGEVLAREVADSAVAGFCVVELGCGLALPSLAAAMGGAYVLATDWSPDAVELAQENARRNALELETALVRWSEPEALLERAPWDLVLADYSLPNFSAPATCSTSGAMSTSSWQCCRSSERTCSSPIPAVRTRKPSSSAQPRTGRSRLRARSSNSACTSHAPKLIFRRA